jgi:uracil phosphoribosyltransferase
VREHETDFQESVADGYRLQDEKQTLIVPLMRSSEPLALGISRAFPTARFLHTSRPEDITAAHLAPQQTVILVDSVINTGKAMITVAQHVRMLHPTVRIVVVAGVVKKELVQDEKSFLQKLAHELSFTIVSLALSEEAINDGTDTGDRLFNTTRAPLFTTIR